MAYSYFEKKRIRKDFGKSAQVMEYPFLLSIQLDSFRKKRNIGGYERAGLISDQEATEMLSLAEKLLDMVKEWLRANHPEFLTK